MPASNKHADYSSYQPRWKLVKDCVAGSAVIKKAGTTYLPKPSPDDNSTENTNRYNDYKLRANFVGFTNHTKKGMIGMVFRKETIVGLLEPIEYIKNNANGGGLTLDQMTRDILSDVLESGRYGLLVDYPAADENLTKEQVAELELQANILPYAATDVINWRTIVVGGVKKLSLVVLTEEHETISDDGFTVEAKEYHRALILENGRYIQRLYDENDNQVGEDIEPRDSSGSPWSEIPFIFVGAQNNDETVDDAPLYDLAEINLAHYRNSADYEESSFQVGQPTPVVAGISTSWAKDVMGGKVALGSMSSILLPEGGSASLLQANPNQMPMEGMKEKEQQMIKIGARVIQDNTGQETAEAARIRFSGQNSELATIVGNIESALLQCLEWVGRFMGAEGDNEITINREFYDANLDAQTVIAMIQLADRGDIAKEDVRTRLRKAGWIEEDRDSDTLDAENEENGAGLNLESGEERKTNLPAESEPLEGELMPKGEGDQETEGDVKSESKSTGFANRNGTDTKEPKSEPGSAIATANQAKLDKILAALEKLETAEPGAPEITVNLPENMVNVTVEAPVVNVDSPDVKTTIEPQEVVINSGGGGKVIQINRNESGVITGAEVEEK